jgi:hypothetical protein
MVVIGAVVLGIIFVILLARSLGNRAAAAGAGAGALGSALGSGMPGGRGLGSSGFGGGGRFTTAADGFWIEPAGYSAGDMLIFSYLLEGLRQQQTVRMLGGDRQFIFTGREPSDVRLEGSADAPDDDMPPMTNDDRFDTKGMPYTPQRTDDQPFRGHPGAY